MKIYTKSGDKGKTSLFSGKRVEKYNLSIQAYGTIDELNSWIGLIKDVIPQSADIDFVEIQETLFTLGSYLATGGDEKMIEKLPVLSDAPITSLEEAIDEGIPILDNTSPKEFLLDDEGKLKGMKFEKMEAQYTDGKRKLIPTGEEIIIECDDVLLAIGQDNAFPWIEKNIGIDFNEWDCPIVDKTTMQSSHPKVFFGGDAAWGPENIIWAVAHGHQAAISIDNFCSEVDLFDRPPPLTNLVSQKMGIHEWSYDNDISQEKRFSVPHEELSKSLKNLKTF